MVRGPDASKIGELTSETGEVKGNKVTYHGAAASHFDVGSLSKVIFMAVSVIIT